MLRLECIVVNVLDVMKAEEDASDFLRNPATGINGSDDSRVGREIAGMSVAVKSAFLEGRD
jgi:uncharacterized protein (DUF2384 family)